MYILQSMNNHPDIKTQNITYIKSDDYKPFDFAIPNIFLDFIIEKEKVIVKTELKIVKIKKDANKIILDGVNISIKSIYLDQLLLDEKDYIKNDKNIVIGSINNDELSTEELKDITLDTRIEKILDFAF